MSSDSSGRQLFKAGSIIAGGILLGRVAGLFRDVLLAKTFGANSEADAAALLLTIPDLLTTLLVGGAMSAALIPEFQVGLGNGRLFLKISAIVLLVFSAIACLLGWQLETFLYLLAPGQSQSLSASFKPIFLVSLAALPLSVLASVSTSYLQAHNKFASPAFGTLLFNLAVICVLVIPTENAVSMVAIGVVAGCLVRWLVQLISSFPITVSWKSTSSASPGLLKHYLRAVAQGSLLILVPVIARAVASLHDTGALALYNYSIRIVELPLGIALSIFSIVLFPRFAKARSEGRDIANEPLLAQSLAKVFYLGLVFTAVIIALLACLQKFPVSLGNLRADQLAKIASLSIISLFALVPRGLSSLNVMLFNSHRDTKTPLFINFVAVAALVLISIALKEDLSLHQIALMTASVYWLIFFSECFFLKRMHSIRIVSLLTKGIRREI